MRINRAAVHGDHMNMRKNDPLNKQIPEAMYVSKEYYTLHFQNVLLIDMGLHNT